MLVLCDIHLTWFYHPAFLNLILSSCSPRIFSLEKNYGLCKGKVQNPGGQRPSAYFTDFLSSKYGRFQPLVQLHCVFALCIYIVYLYCVLHRFYTWQIRRLLSLVYCVFLCVYFTDCIFALCISKIFCPLNTEDSATCAARQAYVFHRAD